MQKDSIRDVWRGSKGASANTYSCSNIFINIWFYVRFRGQDSKSLSLSLFAFELSYPLLPFPKEIMICILLMIKQLKCCPYFIAPDTLITVWKVSKYRVFSGPFFPYSRIRKTRTIKNSVFGQLSRRGCSFTFRKVE